MKIDILDLQDKLKLDKKKITQCAKFILDAMGEGSKELSIVFVTDSYIKKLNLRYRKVNSKTDVLAFPMREGGILGDVVISTETARVQAKKRKVPFQKEINLYLAHGILHLLGYDDRTLPDRAKMQAKQNELLEKL